MTKKKGKKEPKKQKSNLFFPGRKETQLNRPAK